MYRSSLGKLQFWLRHYYFTSTDDIIRLNKKQRQASKKGTVNRKVPPKGRLPQGKRPGPSPSTPGGTAQRGDECTVMSGEISYYWSHEDGCKERCVDVAYMFCVDIFIDVPKRSHVLSPIFIGDISRFAPRGHRGPPAAVKRRRAQGVITGLAARRSTTVFRGIAPLNRPIVDQVCPPNEVSCQDRIGLCQLSIFIYTVKLVPQIINWLVGKPRGFP